MILCLLLLLWLLRLLRLPKVTMLLVLMGLGCCSLMPLYSMLSHSLCRWNRFDSNSTASGIYTCKSPYVWRDAWPGNATCVISSVRSQAKFDNTQDRLLNVYA